MRESRSSAERVPCAPRFSLVLGAGGRPGLAYHAGTLLALEQHGLVAHDATSITGTSAGSIATAILAAGGLVSDLVAYTSNAPARAEFRDMDELIQAADRRFPGIDLTALARLFEPRSLPLAFSELRARRYLAAVTALVPGVVQIRRRFAFLDLRRDVVSPVLWRIVAGQRPGPRHVFTVGDAPLSLAVAASCAVPGVFAPVAHAGRRLVDGGIHSMTHADLAAEDRSELVIVVAPALGIADGTPTPTRAHRILDREVRALEQTGKRVIVFRPSDATRKLVGRNPLHTKRCPDITTAAFDEAHDQLARLGQHGSRTRNAVAAIAAPRSGAPFAARTPAGTGSP
jgi:NTE family protein